MDNKLKFYAENENALLESVKSTILKAYEKSEKSIEQFRQKLSESESRMKNKEIELANKETELINQKNIYEAKIKNLESQLQLKISQIDQLTTSHKVLQENYKKLEAENLNSKKQVKEQKEITNKKQIELDNCNNKLEEYAKHIKYLTERPCIIQTQNNSTVHVKFLYKLKFLYFYI